MKRPVVFVLSLLLFAAHLAREAAAQGPKNVILFVADGGGFSTVEATGYYVGNLGHEVFRGPGWFAQAISTYPLRRDTKPGSTLQDPNTVYNSSQAWNTTPTGANPLEFQGYAWHDATAPDSANTISAAMTGRKSYNNALNVDGAGNALPTFAQLAHEQYGMRTAVVTTVQISDATPATFSGISNQSRTNRTEIADQMLHAEYIDVIMGAGNPDFNDDGLKRVTPDNAWISAETWADLTDGDERGFSGTWQLIQDKEAFEALASGDYVPGKKLLGIVKAFEGKQQYRSADGGLKEDYTTLPNQHLRSDVPNLKTMVQGALKRVDNPKGFFLGIEQGEVDRAMHKNHLGRMIEAKLEFDAAVTWVDEYLTANAGDPTKPNYANTLVVVTADHDHQLYGPDGDSVPFQPLVDHGAGHLPGAKFQTVNHSNHLVPIFAKGPAADVLNMLARRNDFYTDGTRTFGRGTYLDQTDLLHVFMTAIRAR